MRIIEKDSNIEKKINSLIAKQANDLLKKRKDAIRNKIVTIVTQAILNSPEINSLSSGTLKYDFGLTFDPTAEILNSIVSTIRLGINPITVNRSKITGGITLYIQPSSYSNLLMLQSAYQEIKDGEIPWLQWLLFSGDSIIIADFGVEYGSGFGRSGGAKMNKDFAPFRVDPSFSGVVDDNFITRALIRYQSQITSAIVNGLK